MVFEKIDLSREGLPKTAQTAAGRRLLAEMAAKHYGVRDFPITCNENGKPLTDDFFFNISHAGQWVVCALSDRPVGIDVEVLKPIKARPRYLLFSEKESRYVNASKDRERRFFTLWTRKEAYLKALGGRLADMADFELVNDDLQLTPEKNGFVLKTHFFADHVVSACEKKENQEFF